MSEIDFMMDHVVPRLKKILKNNEILIAEFSTDPTNYIILQKILENNIRIDELHQLTGNVITPLIKGTK